MEILGDRFIPGQDVNSFFQILGGFSRFFQTLQHPYFQRIYLLQGDAKTMDPLSLLCGPKTGNPRVKLTLKRSKQLVKSYKMRYSRCQYLN